MNHEHLPSIANAALPETYQRAKVALAECAKADECMDWADKAAALASYAKQSEDTYLERMATRIKGRAIRRAGELLKAVEPAKNQYDKSAKAGAHPGSRGEAAEEAGISPHQAKQAIRVANVPEEEFDTQIESDNPPTITKLADQGKKPRTKTLIDLGGRDHSTFNGILHFVGDLRRAADALEKLEPAKHAINMDAKEMAKAQEYIRRLDAACDRLAMELRA